MASDVDTLFPRSAWEHTVFDAPRCEESTAKDCSQMGAGHASIVVKRKGRSRPFPAQAVIGPTFTSGCGAEESRPFSHPIGFVSRIHAAPASGGESGRIPVNGDDIAGSRYTRHCPARELGVNTGPMTGCAGKGRKRVLMLFLFSYLIQPVHLGYCGSEGYCSRQNQSRFAHSR